MSLCLRRRHSLPGHCRGNGPLAHAVGRPSRGERRRTMPKAPGRLGARWRPEALELLVTQEVAVAPLNERPSRTSVGRRSIPARSPRNSGSEPRRGAGQIAPMRRTNALLPPGRSPGLEPSSRLRRCEPCRSCRPSNDPRLRFEHQPRGCSTESGARPDGRQDPHARAGFSMDT